jgi:catechol 2,3-dioxygenase-like lactoylglutathione lyase family enzyme
MKPAVTHIAETALYVDDLDRAAAFYTAVTGLAILRRDERFCALHVAPQQVLLLFPHGASRTPAELAGGTVPAHHGSGHLHVCFGIAAEAVADWEQRLAAAGIAVESRVNWPSGAISLYLRDPDGHLVELATPGVFEPVKPG